MKSIPNVNTNSRQEPYGYKGSLVGRRVAAARKNAGLSQKQLGEAIPGGMSVSGVSRLELRGTTKAELLKQVARACKVPVAWLRDDTSPLDEQLPERPARLINENAPALTDEEFMQRKARVLARNPWAQPSPGRSA